jgi:hypothetical protein
VFRAEELRRDSRNQGGVRAAGESHDDSPEAGHDGLQAH